MAAVCRVGVGGTSPTWVMFVTAAPAILEVVRASTLRLRGRQPVTGMIEAEGGRAAGVHWLVALLALLERLVEGDGSEAPADGLGGEFDAGGAA